MTTSRWSPGSAGGMDADRFGVRCSRCARTQPPLPHGVYTCAYCGATLPLRRWVAHPPPGVGGSLRVRLIRRPYIGPPSYGGAHPRWGFPPVIWRTATVGTTTVGADAAYQASAVRAPAPRWVAVASAVTAAACFTSAAAETWRYVLLLRGRTEVLPGAAVRTNDLLVGTASLVALLCAVATAALAVPLLIRLHRAAAVRAGLAPSRTPAALAARLLIPGWNVYGAGLVLTEIDRMTALAGADGVDQGSGVPRARRVTVLWWWAWVLNAVLVLAALLRAFGRSPQAIADTVELHIAVDLTGALVAGLLAAVVTGLGRSRSARQIRRYAGWLVLPPRSRPVTRGGSGPGRTEVAGPPCTGPSEQSDAESPGLRSAEDMPGGELADLSTDPAAADDAALAGDAAVGGDAAADDAALAGDAAVGGAPDSL